MSFDLPNWCKETKGKDVVALGVLIVRRWGKAVWRLLHDSAFSAFAFASCVCLGFLGWLGPLHDWQAEKKVCEGSCLSKRFFGVDFAVQDVSADFCIPADLKASCQKADSCSSPSKRKLGFVCDSNFSHNERCSSCVEYLRLRQRLPSGERGGHPI